MRIHFLGTNGWYSSNTGLTPCVLVDSEECYVIFDAGGGIYKLDQYISDPEKPVYLFLSHFHIDHIHGLHILCKFHFKKGLKIFCKKGGKKILERFIQAPFTAGFELFDYPVEIIEIDEGGHKDPIPFSCLLLPHPDPSMGYRLTLENKTIAYCTDTGPHNNINILAKDADIFISECAFLTGETMESWPHMNPENAAIAAKKAGAKQLILMHFDAFRYDTIEKRKDAEKIAKEIFPNTVAATDDMTIEL